MKKAKKQRGKITSPKLSHKPGKKSQTGKVQQSTEVYFPFLLSKYPPNVWEKQTLMKAMKSGYFITPKEVAGIGLEEIKALNALNSSHRLMDFAAYFVKVLASGSLLDTLYLIREAHRCQIYPPKEVMEWLVEGIDIYLKQEGKKRLDVCLGLIGKRGVPDIFSKWQIEMRDHRLCTHMQVLRYYGKLTIEKAADLVSTLPGSLSSGEIVARYNKNQTWKNTKKACEVPSENTLWLSLREYDYETLPPQLRQYYPFPPSAKQ